MTAPIRHHRGDLRPDQVQVVERIHDDWGVSPGLFLVIEMGLGKTVTTLTALRDLLDECVVRRPLVIAPLRVAEITWPDEIAQWSHLRPLSYSVITGTAAEREEALRRHFAENREIAIINRENLVWLYKTLGGVRKWPFDVLVYDESSRLKAGKQRSRLKRLNEFGVLAKVRHRMSFALCLTGTPAPNGVIDVWGQVFILDLGRRLGTTRDAFLRRWFEKDFSGFKWKPRTWAKRKIIKRIRDITISVRAKDVLEHLPEKLTANVVVNLTKKQMATYKRLERELALEEYDVVAANKGVLTGKLIQFANGGLYRTDEDDPKARRETIEIHDHKLEALESIVRETRGEPLLVGYSFQFDLDRILKRFPQAVPVGDDPEVFRRWNRGEIEMLVAHPGSIGHGMNLQHGGRRIVWYGLTSSLELYQQFNKRLDRPGQASDTVFFHHIIARGTFDDKLLDLLRNKATTQDSITHAVRLHLRQAA